VIRPQGDVVESNLGKDSIIPSDQPLSEKEFTDPQLGIVVPKYTTIKNFVEDTGITLEGKQVEYESLIRFLEEHRDPGITGSVQLNPVGEVVYSGLDGEIRYVVDRNIYYIQFDPAGASTLSYYGPYSGNPREVLAAARANSR